MTDTTATDGLRARKRRATERSIESAAVTLALEHGFDGVTVEAICERADISRSTFFNYFPSRDTAILGRPIEPLTGADADAVLDTSPDDLPHALFLLMFASIGHSQVHPDVSKARARLVAEQPMARRYGSTILVESGENLMAVAAAWLRAHPEHARLAGKPEREASLAVNALYTALVAMASNWSSGVVDFQANIDEFDATMRDLRTVLAN